MRKRMAVLVGIAGTFGALVAREALQRRADRRHFEDGREYWRAVMPGEDVRWADAHLTSYRIPSDGLGIHVDVFAQADASAPAVVLVHGLLTYGRLFLPLVRRWHAQGYTVICPDISGNGFSGGIRGDYPVPQATRNVVDVTLWARQRFDGPLYLQGISLGGALAYYAASAGAPVAAISCMDLFTFNDPVTLRQIVSEPRLADVLPRLAPLAGPFGWVRLPVSLAQKMDKVVAEDEAPYTQGWMHDPLPPRDISLRTLASAITSPPAVPLEFNTIPTVVICPGRDEVIPPAVTKAAYAELGGPKKLVELPGAAHWSFTGAFFDALVNESAAWFQQHQVDAALETYALNGVRKH